MEFSMQALEEAGAFMPARPEKREIEWFVMKEDGSKKDFKATIYVRKLSFATLSAESMSMNYRDNVIAARIAASVVDAKGKPVFTADDLIGNEERGPICESLGLALLKAVAEVNNLKGEEKNSQPPMKSGTKSCSPASAAKRSRKPKSA
ncbi:phage tail assembly chaperone family protein, TAC [Alkalimonas sp. NCh-2]|uniref:phage tail assembly chaperone family protein, TAC n=1 Tax=Alkalimonas sp. NCh-2 TaxID=3144846 RepID=UPI0031F6FA3F